jgi:hypothetical protein
MKYSIGEIYEQKEEKQNVICEKSFKPQHSPITTGKTPSPSPPPPPPSSSNSLSIQALNNTRILLEKIFMESIETINEEILKAKRNLNKNHDVFLMQNKLKEIKKEKEMILKKNNDSELNSSSITSSPEILLISHPLEHEELREEIVNLGVYTPKQLLETNGKLEKMEVECAAIHLHNLELHRFFFLWI